MDLKQAVTTVLTQKYADFTGRAMRSELWWFVLFNIIVSVILGIVDGIIFGMSILQSLYALGTLIPSIAVGVRRMHDIDKSGWWLLIALVPVIGVIVLIYFYAQPGQREANRFGPPPIA